MTVNISLCASHVRRYCLAIPLNIVMIFTNINPFLYIKDQFALANLQCLSITGKSFMYWITMLIYDYVFWKRPKRYLFRVKCNKCSNLKFWILTWTNNFLYGTFLCFCKCHYYTLLLRHRQRIIGTNKTLTICRLV